MAPISVALQAVALGILLLPSLSGLALAGEVSALAKIFLLLHLLGFFALRLWDPRGSSVLALASLDAAFFGALLAHSEGAAESLLLPLALVGAASFLRGGIRGFVVTVGFAFAAYGAAAAWSGAPWAWPAESFRSLARYTLEPELTYRTEPVAPLAGAPIARMAALVSSALLIGLLVIVTSAYRERKRILAAFRRAEALEAIVDSWLRNPSETAFWHTVLRVAETLAGCRVVLVHRNRDQLWFRLPDERGAEDDPLAFLRRVRIDSERDDSLLARCFRDGKERSGHSLAELLGPGAEGIPAWRATAVPVPAARPEVVLLAVARESEQVDEEGLREVARRTGLVLEAWEEERGAGVGRLEEAGVGVNA
ncbi:MAG: hypothetical protein KatS3mg076_0401 [Candidatus Binatia bacterium]|nr:MAG: hypothetical protein KatS3mg076_0401 [Candidatus Binatia bacterium]